MQQKRYIYFGVLLCLDAEVLIVAANYWLICKTNYCEKNYSVLHTIKKVAKIRKDWRQNYTAFNCMGSISPNFRARIKARNAASFNSVTEEKARHHAI